MKIRDEKGQALLLAMIAILVGAIAIPSFLGHVGASITGSRNYRDAIDAQYACDAGAEHAIWNLTEGGIDSSIPDSGDNITYNLGESINGLTTSVKISNAWEEIAWDNFNSGGFTGGGGWLNTWTYSGYADVVTTGVPVEGAYHMRLRGSTGLVSRSVNLSQQVNAHLRFWAKADSFETGNTAICRISHNGSAWTTLQTWTEGDADGVYRYYDIDLTPYGLAETFYISFQANMNSTGDFLYVDDLDVVWPATTVKLIGEDDFESGDWTGGEGWLGDWTHTGSSSVNATGAPHDGVYHLQLLDDDGYAARAVDLSAQSVARLQFWAKANEFEGGDVANCLVSSNGIDWTTVYTWTDSDADDIYRYYDIDISDFDLTDEFWIAFQAGMSRYDDYFYVDDVSINAIRAYCITVTAGDRILKAAVDLMDGAENVLCWWFIV